MNNLAVIENNTQATMWESSDDLKQIKETFGKGLSSAEFNTLVQMGRATGLNPFLKEIWAVKYGERAAQIFIGRDGYRKSAQRHPLYDYHLADAVYSNDKFDVVNGEVTHKYNLGNRGNLVGAYCIVQRKGSSRPTYVFVELKEYTTNKSLWAQDGKPATMIKKVAEAQGLRAAFQELFAGTYSECEAWQTKDVQQKPQGVQGLKAKLGIANVEQPIANDFDHETGEIIEAVIEEKTEENNNADTMVFLIESACNANDLAKAMKGFKSLSQEDKTKVYEVYKEKSEEFKK